MSKVKTSIHLKNYQHPDQFGQWLGYQIISINSVKSAAKVSLQLRDDHLSPAKRVHGGVIAAFFDFACGAAVFATMKPEDFCSTVELKVNYYKPLNSGDLLTCESKAIFRGNRLCSVIGMLYRKGEKEPVAMATGTYNIVSAKNKKGK